MTISDNRLERASHARAIRRNKILFVVLLGFVLTVFASSMTHLKQEMLENERTMAP